MRKHSRQNSLQDSPNPTSFQPNGCSFVPDLDVGVICDRHDRDYSRGGSDQDRFQADQAFRDGILEKGGPFHFIIGWTYYWGVRLLGRFFFRFNG